MLPVYMAFILALISLGAKMTTRAPPRVLTVHRVSNRANGRKPAASCMTEEATNAGIW